MIKKPKLLFILHLSPVIHGAVEVGSSILQSEAINKNFAIDYINLATASSLKDIGRFRIKKGLAILSLWWQVFRALLNNSYQLCYITINSCGAAWYKDLVIVALVRLFGIPVLYHLHNKGVKPNAGNLIKRALYRFQFKGVKCILLSPLLYKDIEEFVKEKDVFYCANGIADQDKSGKGKDNRGRRQEEEGEKTREGDREKEREEHTITNIQQSITNDQQPIANILFLSNLIESKGVWLLLEACARLKSNKTAFNLVIIGGEGDITESQLNEQIRQLGLSEVVSYRGKRYGVEKRQAFAEADIFAFPTYHDCFPLVLLEAMSWSLPVVSTFEGGISDVVEEGVTGFLVPQRDVAALAVKLETLIGNPALRQQMGAAGRERYEREFTLERFEERMVEILERARS